MNFFLAIGIVLLLELGAASGDAGLAASVLFAAAICGVEIFVPGVGEDGGPQRPRGAGA